MPEIRGLSLTQPWAQLVVLGQKKYETRSWKTNYRGLIAIHASKEFPDSARMLLHENPFSGVLHCLPGDLPLGAIVGTVDLVDCQVMTGDEYIQMTRKEIAFGDWSEGRYAWKLENPKLLPEPIPYKGAHRLWRMDAPV